MAPTIILRSINNASNTVATFEVTFQGFTVGDSIEVQFFEMDTDDSLMPTSRTQPIGKVAGQIALFLDPKPKPPVFTLTPTTTPPKASTKAQIKFVFPSPGSAPGAGTGKEFVFDLPTDKFDKQEGDFWEIQATIDTPAAQSAIVSVARINRALNIDASPREATYAWHGGNDVKFYNDADANGGDTGAFADISSAIREAKSFVFIADWSFHPYVRLLHNTPADINSTVGALLASQANANPKLLIAIHTWLHLPVGAKDTQNNQAATHLNNIAQTVLKANKPSNLLWRASARTGIGYSHHQKYVILDTPAKDGRRAIRVFFGGLDMTKGRYDWQDHLIFDTDTKANLLSDIITHNDASGKLLHEVDDWYSGEFWADVDARGGIAAGKSRLPRQPWHDVHARLTGPTAWDFVREFVGRWGKDPAKFDFPTPRGADGDTSDAAIEQVNNKYKSLFDGKLPDGNTPEMVQQWEQPDFGPWSGQVYRSIKKEHWESPTTVSTFFFQNKLFEWNLPTDAESSIEKAYVQAINQAERFIYIETQYLIGSGTKWGRPSVANRIPETIVARILQRIADKQPFHAYILLPMFPEGPPSDQSNGAQRQFEWNTMHYMASEVSKKAPGGRWQDFLSFCFLANWKDQKGSLTRTADRADSVRDNNRYMIYVHSKMMIIDDRYVIMGSANLNERSLNGARDTEICVGLWPNNDKVAKTCVDQVQEFRQRLWSEHLNPRLPAQWQTPEDKACINAVQSAALDNYKQFREGHRTKNSGHMALWPIDLTKQGFPLLNASSAPEGNDHIPDSQFTFASFTDRLLGNLSAPDPIWFWHAPGPHKETKVGITLVDFLAPSTDIAE